MLTQGTSGLIDRFSAECAPLVIFQSLYCQARDPNKSNFFRFFLFPEAFGWLHPMFRLCQKKLSPSLLSSELSSVCHPSPSAPTNVAPHVFGQPTCHEQHHNAKKTLQELQENINSIHSILQTTESGITKDMSGTLQNVMD